MPPKCRAPRTRGPGWRRIGPAWGGWQGKKESGWDGEPGDGKVEQAKLASFSASKDPFRTQMFPGLLIIWRLGVTGALRRWLNTAASLSAGPDMACSEVAGVGFSVVAGCTLGHAWQAASHATRGVLQYNYPPTHQPPLLPTSTIGSPCRPAGTLSRTLSGSLSRCWKSTRHTASL